jgi:hypothetical protein
MQTNEQPNNEDPQLAEVFDPSDPFSGFSGDTDTSYPILIGALYDLKVKKLERGPNKDNTGEKIAFELVTTAVGTDTTGQLVQPGYVIHHNIGITESAKYSKDQIKRTVDAFLQSAGMNVRTIEFLRNPSIARDKIVRAKTGVSRETDEYPAKTKILSFVKV